MDNRSLEEIRIEKLGKIENPYPDRYEVNEEIYNVGSLEDGVAGVRIAGRIMSIRKMGKLTFFHIADIVGQIQAAIKKDELGEEKYTFFHQVIDIGDFIGLDNM